MNHDLRLLLLLLLWLGLADAKETAQSDLERNIIVARQRAPTVAAKALGPSERQTRDSQSITHQLLLLTATLISSEGRREGDVYAPL
jgi:hypothetical protein